MTRSVGSDLNAGQIVFQQEGAEVGEGIDVFIIPDVPAGKFDAAVNIRILFAADQGSHGLGSPVFGLHFHRNQGVGCSDEEILLQRGIIPLIGIEPVTPFDQRFANHIFVKRALIDAEVLVDSQILLGFLVQHGHKQAAVGKVDFILRIVIVALKRQFREIQAVADIDHSRIIQPFHTSSIVTETSAGGNFGDLKFLVVLGELHGNVVEYINIDPPWRNQSKSQKMSEFSICVHIL